MHLSLPSAPGRWEEVGGPAQGPPILLVTQDCLVTELTLGPLCLMAPPLRPDVVWRDRTEPTAPETHPGIGVLLGAILELVEAQAGTLRPFWSSGTPSNSASARLSASTTTTSSCVGTVPPLGAPPPRVLGQVPWPPGPLRSVDGGYPECTGPLSLRPPVGRKTTLPAHLAGPAGSGAPVPQRRSGHTEPRPLCPEPPTPGTQPGSLQVASLPGRSGLGKTW